MAYFQKRSPLAVAGAITTGLLMAGAIVLSEAIRYQLLAPTRARTLLDTTVRFTDAGTAILPAVPGSWVTEIGLRTARSFYRLGPVIGEYDPERMSMCERPLELIAGPQDPPGNYGARFFSYRWTNAEQAGLEESFVFVPTPNGEAPAKFWHNPNRPSKDTWVVAVHGRGAIQEEMLRLAHIVGKDGYPTLAITYRNDQVGGPVTDGVSHMGASEWEDVDHAIRYALDHGAKQVILAGASQGGSLIGYWLYHVNTMPALIVSDPSKVIGLILDSPLIQVYGALSAAIHESGVPKGIDGVFAMAATGWMMVRGPRQVVLVDHLPTFSATDLPILLFLGMRDSMVLPEPGLELAAFDHVTTMVHDDAEHVEIYNEDPAGFERITRNWIDQAITAHAALPSPGELREGAVE